MESTLTYSFEIVLLKSSSIKIVQSVLETPSVFLFYFKVFLKVAEEADAEEEGTKYFRPIVVQILLVTVTLSFYLQVKVCCLKGE